MALVEAAAAALVFTKLDVAQDYGDAGPAQIATARAQLQVVANAFAKCIPHLVAQATVSTNINATVSGAVASPATAGAVAGSGTGTIGGLIQGDSAASTGLAGEIVAVLEDGIVALPGADLARAREQLDVIADACAEFAAYVIANALVSTTDTGTATTLGVNGPTTGTGSGTVS